MSHAITRSLRLIRKLDPISPICDAVAGMYLLLMWDSVKGSHNGERGR